jgi:1-deoxy-D-xylulose-5-phosphate synthase
VSEKTDRLLDRIDGSADLKQLPREELPQLAAEIRALIQETVAQNAGHLASNLGVVELTIALHYVFDFPTDKLVWDVGHQCYTHKILTGRRDRFGSLRRRGGVSGFPSPDESPCDTFLVGHSGTSLSTALGLFLAMEAKGDPGRVVAVIGDGSIATGMALEALNHIGSLGAPGSPGPRGGADTSSKVGPPRQAPAGQGARPRIGRSPLLLVLNDNRMTISETVGALANYLSRLRAAPLYNELKRDVRTFLDGLPLVGAPMENVLEFLKDTVRHALVSGRMFEDLGLRYFGPIDGHNLNVLVSTLREIRQLRTDKPILLHVITEKGRGFTPASRDPTAFHSCPPFETGDGEVCRPVAKDGRSYTDAFADALVDLARQDPRIVAVTAAMPTGTGLARFAQAFPERFYDVGICEQHAVGLAAGLAAGGLRPVVAIYSTFLQRACDQVFHELCLQRLPVVLAIDRAGLVPGDGPTHQGLYDVGWLRPFPGLTLAAPKDGAELAALLAWALRQPGPVALRYPKAPLPPPDLFPASSSPVEAGRAEVLAESPRPGGAGSADVVLVAYGGAVEQAARARQLLLAEGPSGSIEASLVNARFAKPLDNETLGKCLAEAALVVTIEDGALAGGFGSAVAELATRIGRRAESALPGGEPQAPQRSQTSLVALGVPDVFLEHGSREELLREVGLDARGIARSVQEALALVRARAPERARQAQPARPPASGHPESKGGNQVSSPADVAPRATEAESARKRGT